MLDLFSVDDSNVNLNPAFIALKNSTYHQGVRTLINEVFEEMGDPDGNFVGHFQTNGFHARIFELCCYMFLKDEKFVVKHISAPDYYVRDGNIDFYLEATTSNPVRGSNIDISLNNMSDLPLEHLHLKHEHEMPIRMGSALFSKLNKKYWELEWCKGKPIILAIGPFHEAGSMFFDDSCLAYYLYGIKQYPTWSESGDLVIESEQLQSHSYEGKIIPSRFFGQKNTEHISAVLFSNSFTVPKFLRMGVNQGYQTPHGSIRRVGYCLDPDPNSATPLQFEYDVRSKDAPKEYWGQGASLFINPNASVPISPDIFKTIKTTTYNGTDLISKVPSMFYPIISMTICTTG